MLCPSCGVDAGDVSKFCPSCGTGIVRALGADDYIGKILAGKYRVEQMIGEGGMGKVYRAKQIALDKPVVLKVLRQSLLSDERTVARFQREAKAASRLNHPNSINVLDFGQDDDGAMFIAMEYVSGKDLHQILSKEWPLPEARVVRILSQVLSALSDAHNAGVIHRDLKPENIMIEQRRNEPDFVKVLDFGIAKISDASGEDGPALTRTGFVCGTPEYMSPEQARGAVLDARSDLYAVGVILYQLTCGLLPFESDSAVGFATKHLTQEPPPPSKRRPEAKISPGMERLILRALSKEPADRPQNAEAFKSELLEVNRERRNLRRSGVLSPIPRRTPSADNPVSGSAATTRLSGEPAWGAEQTQPESIPASMSTTAAGAAVDSKVLPPPEGASVWVFKAVTVVLVAAAMGLGGYYFHQVYLSSPTPDYQPPPNAPVQLGKGTAAPLAMGLPPSGTRPLYELDIPTDQRDPKEAEKLLREANLAHEQGNNELAALKYAAAFEKDPNPELSLKLGELYLQRNDSNKAKGWWARHLRDQTHSKAKSYIQQVFPDL